MESQLTVRFLTYSWLCADLGSAGAGLSVLVGVDWVVEEESVLVEVVLGLLDLHPGGQGECIFRSLYSKSI